MIVVQILNYLLLENKLSDSTVMNEKKKTSTYGCH